ncbi:hypothetical protein PP590_gp38 [Pseudoalteromonas phage HS1]|uniref:hypothetical protein n=1 Tax=Pseudoalteromonas phage HS5 TaxID=1357709 RepID=UPI0023297B53|nr:hypothetical protein PP589_gp33 [Pseudoalteromonas phage HS5]YP_010660195.1 hypothetical protein PP590_gp38 [Pseudoalteromonas phage HS1]
MIGKYFTTKEIKLIREMKASGSTYYDIAKVTDRSYESIKKAAQRFGIARKDLSDFEKAIVMSGDSPTTIGLIVNRTGREVSNLRCRRKKKMT